MVLQRLQTPASEVRIGKGLHKLCLLEMAWRLLSYLCKAKGRPPCLLFALTLAHDLFYLCWYIANCISGVGKNAALAAVFILCAMNGELVFYHIPVGKVKQMLSPWVSQIWKRTAGRERLKQEILVVHHNVVMHFVWAVVLLLSRSVTAYHADFLFYHSATCLITCALNLMYYQTPKDAKSWKQAMDESSECPFAAEARRKNLSKEAFEQLRLTYHDK